MQFMILSRLSTVYEDIDIDIDMIQIQRRDETYWPVVIVPTHPGGRLRTVVRRRLWTVRRVLVNLQRITQHPPPHPFRISDHPIRLQNWSWTTTDHNNKRGRIRDFIRIRIQDSINTISFHNKTTIWEEEVSSMSCSITVKSIRPDCYRCSTDGKTYRGISNTTFPNISKNRRYESQAKRGLLVLVAKPWTTASFIPKFNTVSIFTYLVGGVGSFRWLVSFVGSLVIITRRKKKNKNNNGWWEVKRRSGGRRRNSTGRAVYFLPLSHVVS